ALGIVAAVVLTRLRKHLASKWLWTGVAASVLIFLPNVLWQARHQFISLEFLSYLHARDSRQGRYHGFYAEQLQICVNPVNRAAGPVGAVVLSGAARGAALSRAQLGICSQLHAVRGVRCAIVLHGAALSDIARCGLRVVF